MTKLTSKWFGAVFEYGKTNVTFSSEDEESEKEEEQRV